MRQTPPDPIGHAVTTQWVRREEQGALQPRPLISVWRLSSTRRNRNQTLECHRRCGYKFAEVSWQLLESQSGPGVQGCTSRPLYFPLLFCYKKKKSPCGHSVGIETGTGRAKPQKKERGPLPSRGSPGPRPQASGVPAAGRVTPLLLPPLPLTSTCSRLGLCPLNKQAKMPPCN